MSDYVLKRVLEKSLMRELAKYENAPEHKFSLKHRLAMKRIFAECKRNVRNLREKEQINSSSLSEHKSQLSLKKRLFFATVVIILMTFLVGWTVVYVSEKISRHGIS